MKKLTALFFTALLLTAGTACSGREPAEPAEPTYEVTIPGSYLTFIDADPEELAEDYRDHCTAVQVEESSLVLTVTHRQREALTEMNTAFIDDAVQQFEAAGDGYYCELAGDYKSVVYGYDEALYEKDRDENTHIQAAMLQGVTAMHALNGILHSGGPDWQITVTIENCRTGAVVAEAALPDGSLFLGEEEWAASCRRPLCKINIPRHSRGFFRCA